MSELKARHVVDVYDDYAEYLFEEYSQVYIKSEADKVIADLEESHKKEVGQLLMEIAEQKEKRDTAEKLLNKALDSVSNGKNHMMSLARKKNHADYKRCLDKAGRCGICAQFEHYKVIRFDNPFYLKRAKWLEKWRDRWLKIAESFKEAK